MKISVVIPTYNRADLLPRAVQSALNQTSPPYEIIVIDDGSTDSTSSVIKAYGDNVIYCHQDNAGVSAARNKGVELAQGDYICFLDSDDYFDPDWLQAAIGEFSLDGACGAVCANVVIVDESENIIERKNVSEITRNNNLIFERLFNYRFMVGSNLCVRRDLVNLVGGFDPGFETGEDIDFTLRLAINSPIRHVPRELVFVTRTAGSLSAKINTGNRLRVFEKFERTYPDGLERFSRSLSNAKGKAALDYALDLTVARVLDSALEKAKLSWHYSPSWKAAKQVVKIFILMVFRAR